MRPPRCPSCLFPHDGPCPSAAVLECYDAGDPEGACAVARREAGASPPTDATPAVDVGELRAERDALVAEVAQLRASLAAATRRADRLAHGGEVESDRICSHEMAEERLREEVEEARGHLERGMVAVPFLRSEWRNDGAEGESVHRVADAVEAAIAALSSRPGPGQEASVEEAPTGLLAAMFVPGSPSENAYKLGREDERADLVADLLAEADAIAERYRARAVALLGPEIKVRGEPPDEATLRDFAARLGKEPAR